MKRRLTDALLQSLAEKGGDDFRLRTRKAHQLSRRPTLHGFALVPKALEEPVEDVLGQEHLVTLLLQGSERGEAGGNVIRAKPGCDTAVVHKLTFFSRRL